MPQAIVKVDKDEFKDALHIPDGCTITGITYNAQTNTVDITVSSPNIPDVQPTPEVRIRYKGFMRRTVYEIIDVNEQVLDEWAKWQPDR